MAATRLVRMSSTPIGFKSVEILLSNLDVSSSRPRTLMCVNKVGLSSDTSPAGAGADERKPVAVKAAACSSACTVILEPKITDKGVDLGSLFAFVGDKLSHWSKLVREQRSWGLHIQMFVEKVINY